MKSLKVVAILLLAALTNLGISQERFLDEVFTNVNTQEDVIYGWNWSVLPTADDQTGTPFGPTLTQYVDSLRMDVYMPAGDTMMYRPLVLLSHAGSYLPPSLTGVPFGTKRDSALIEMCMQFARRGFVAVSFTYRLGWNPQGDQETRTSTIIQAVYKAMHDSKSCIRYFKKNAAMYGVDTTKIILGGSNSGAYHALLAGNLNRPEELTIFKFLDSLGNSFIDTTLWGNFDGANGALSHYNHPGHTSDFHMVLTLGGDVGDTSWVDPGEPPVVAFHGVADVGSPYETGIVFTGVGGVPVIEVSGPGDYMPLVNAFGNNSAMAGGGFCDAPASTDGMVYEGNYPFYQAGFEPWGWYADSTPVNPTASRARAIAYIDTIMGYFIPRAYRVLCEPTYTDSCATVGIFEIGKADVDLDIYPNPAASAVTIRLNDFDNPITEVALMNVAGKMVKRVQVDNAYQYTLNRNGLEAGVYFVNIKLADGAETFKRVIFE